MIMEKSKSLILGVVPTLIRNLRDYISVDVSISIFGEKVFSFTWPPKSESPKN